MSTETKKQRVTVIYAFSKGCISLWTFYVTDNIKRTSSLFTTLCVIIQASYYCLCYLLATVYALINHLTPNGKHMYHLDLISQSVMLYFVFMNSMWFLF
jgi:hypothetical protein